MSMETQRGIWIVVSDEVEDKAEEDGGRGIEDIGADYDRYEYHEKRSPSSTKPIYVSASDLKEKVGEFLEVIEEAFDRANRSQFNMQLDELKLSVEINGKGQVSLLGTGGETGGKGAIELKFKRK
ncbi:hypothetical protein POG22_16045 [Geitlerinema sp. CS-897]|nr:hypothetical protein [Geitlerinema sp. CS-897]